MKEKEKENENQEKKEENDIFATFKPYNMKKNEKSSVKSDILLKQQYNKFKYLGKLNEANKNINEPNENFVENISYQKFKTM